MELMIVLDFHLKGLINETKKGKINASECLQIDEVYKMQVERHLSAAFILLAFLDVH